MQRKSKHNGLGMSSAFSSMSFNLKDAFSNIDLKKFENSSKNYNGYEDELKDKGKLSKKKIKELEKEYKEILNRRNICGVAYRVTFLEHPKIIYLSFKPTNNKARWEACKYLIDTFNPEFIGNTQQEIIYKSRAHRQPELDKYALKGKVPIPILMEKLNMKFSCAICGKGNYGYKEYSDERCVIIEGEGDAFPFAEGIVICQKCFHEHFKNS